MGSLTRAPSSQVIPQDQVTSARIPKGAGTRAPDHLFLLPFGVALKLASRVAGGYRSKEKFHILVTHPGGSIKNWLLLGIGTLGSSHPNSLIRNRRYLRWIRCSPCRGLGAATPEGTTLRAAPLFWGEILYLLNNWHTYGLRFSPDSFYPPRKQLPNSLPDP